MYALLELVIVTLFRRLENVVSGSLEYYIVFLVKSFKTFEKLENPGHSFLLWLRVWMVPITVPRIARHGLYIL